MSGRRRRPRSRSSTRTLDAANSARRSSVLLTVERAHILSPEHSATAARLRTVPQQAPLANFHPGLPRQIILTLVRQLRDNIVPLTSKALAPTHFVVYLHPEDHLELAGITQ